MQEKRTGHYGRGRYPDEAAMDDDSRCSGTCGCLMTLAVVAVFLFLLVLICTV